MPYLVFRDRFGKPTDANGCTSDCQSRLADTVARHISLGWRVSKLADNRYEATGPNGTVVLIGIEDMLPDNLPRAPARPRTCL